MLSLLVINSLSKYVVSSCPCCSSINFLLQPSNFLESGPTLEYSYLLVPEFSPPSVWPHPRVRCSLFQHSTLAVPLGWVISGQVICLQTGWAFSWIWLSPSNRIFPQCNQSSYTLEPSSLISGVSSLHNKNCRTILILKTLNPPNLWLT